MNANWRACVFAIVVMALGVSVLVGWAGDIETLKRVLPGMNSMKPNTAIGFVLSGASLLLLSRGRSSGAMCRLQWLTAALTMLLGLVTFSEFVFDWNPGIDQLLFREHVASVYSASPGRMSAFTSLCFALLGGALLLAAVRRGWAIIQAVAVIVGGVSLLALGGNMFGDPSFPNFPRSGAIAIHTAFAFLLVAIAILMTTSGHGMMARLRAHLLTIGFVLAMALLLVAAVAVYVGIQRQQAAARSVEHTYAVLLQLESVSSSLHRYGEMNRAYLTTGQEALHQKTVVATETLLGGLAEMRRMIFNDPVQKKRLDALEPVIRHRLAVGNENVQIRHKQGPAAAAASLSTGVSEHLVAEARDHMHQMEVAEKQLLTERQKIAEITNSASIVALGIAMMLVMGLLLTTFPALQREIARRRRSEKMLALHRDQLEQSVRERTAELARQNRRNELILETTVDGFFAAGQDGRILDSNKAFCQMLGYTREELLQRSISDIEANENPADVAAHIEKVIARKHDRFDTRHRRKDGNLIEIEISVSLVELGGERVFYAFVRDIAPRRASEAALIHSRDEAERANAAKSEFLSRMSHELRTPLNAILGFGQLLETDPDHPLTATQLDNVNEILHAGDHLLELVNEVLDLARIESGRLEINLEPVSVASVIEACLAQIQPLAAPHGISMALELDAPCAVQADRTRLKQVLLNLLSNAIKYNREGGSIQVSCVPSRAQRMRISVKDTGRGIAADALSRLFKPFERMDSAYEGIEGTGIGLALAKKLVEAMRGEIGVESVSGEGSTFWFELPLSTSNPGMLETGAAAASVPAKAAATGGPRKLLYVEDNPANLRLVQKILASRKDFELFDAVSGEAGLEMASQVHPDLILLDINLPGMDGFEVLRCLKDNPATRNIPVIAITANAMTRDIERGKAVGFSDYLTKPIKVSTFTEILEACLRDSAENQA